MTGRTDPGSGTIVVGVDGTAASAAALRWAVQEARLRRASVHLVCADDPGWRSCTLYSGRPVAPRPDEGNAAETRCLARNSRRARPCRRVVCHLS